MSRCFSEVFLLILLIRGISAAYFLDVVYVRQPEEHAYFKLTDETGFNEWSTYVHMNKTLHLREEQILKDIKPLYDGRPMTLRFQSSSITRHIGVQFAYILTKYNIDSMRFENLCSQMKPKFSKLLLETTQRPSKLTFVVHHPTASFVLPEGFRNGCGREELILDAGERSILAEENFDFDSVINTKRLIVKQGTMFRDGLDGSKILGIKASELLLEGVHSIQVDDVKKLGQEWVDGKREIIRWEIHLDEAQPQKFEFDKESTVLELDLQKDKLFLITHSQ